MGASSTAEGLEWLLRQVSTKTGLDVGGCHGDRIVSTVRELYEATGTESHRAYVELLERDDDALEVLIDRLTVGETYFFREPAHLALLRDTIAPAVRSTPTGGVRVWSAGCASGEEAYSVAITLDEAGILEGSYLIGSDLSARALDRAQAATYSPWALRRCDDQQRRRWFHAENGRFQLHARYRDAVRWQRIGLLDGPPAGAFDVVLCRNVLIYLTADAVRAAARTFHDALAPGGWLLLGASDPPLEHPGLERLNGPHGAVYRRVAPRPDRPPLVAPRGAGAPVRRRGRARRPEVLAGSGGPSRSATLCPPDADADADAEPAGAEPEAERHFHAAAAHLHDGRSADAAREAAAALYLDPAMVVGHLLLAQCEDAVGRTGRADRSRRNALALLRDMPPDAVVPLTDRERASDLAAVLVDHLRGAPIGNRP